jgi:hypothetical protein
MCNPILFTCVATHFPLLIDAAMEGLGSHAQLSQEAQQQLYQHGADHKAAFDAALRPGDPITFGRLRDQLRHRLQVALENSPKVDAQGRPFNPPSIGGAALKQALKAPSEWGP